MLRILHPLQLLMGSICKWQTLFIYKMQDIIITMIPNMVSFNYRYWI